MRITSLLILSFLIFFQSVIAQTDTSKIYNCNHYKRGFYKNYKEYLNNAPSDTAAFTIVPLSKKKSDQTMIGAKYMLVDSFHIVENMWGFCDGVSVYVNYPHSILMNRYWKLEYIGLYPIFSFKNKTIFGVGPGIMELATIAASAAAQAQYDLILVDEKGKFKYPSISYTKKILAGYPELLKSFKEQTLKYNKYDNLAADEFEPDEIYQEKMQIIKDFLVKLNESIRNN